ncbi:helix-turn-helix domain-containing protein [Actinotalea solisilvae]|uniref:helix-turn-helix domain-containing protein n=1 Tax=Actinotalea solisilvae TaxID=2072922 RepID=UPI0027DD1185|nr:excisionase family DNA-binding protein [Actinotalea solisilvae]
MASTSPLRLISTSTEPKRRRVREVEQPVINITLQADERRVFNVAEAAAVLGIGRSMLYQLIAAGEIRTIHIGRLCRVPVEAIDEFLAACPSTPRRPLDRQAAGPASATRAGARTRPPTGLQTQRPPVCRRAFVAPTRGAMQTSPYDDATDG